MHCKSDPASTITRESLNFAVVYILIPCTLRSILIEIVLVGNSLVYLCITLSISQISHLETFDHLFGFVRWLPPESRIYAL